jgi:hypothetical protein
VASGGGGGGGGGEKTAGVISGVVFIRPSDLPTKHVVLQASRFDTHAHDVRRVDKTALLTGIRACTFADLPETASVLN